MDAEYFCEACNKTFAFKNSLTKHYGRCKVNNLIKANKNTNSDNRQNEINIIQFKLDEANEIIKELEKKRNDEIKELEQKNNEIIKEIEQKNSELQKSNEILQIRLDNAQTKIEDKNKIIDEKNEEIKDFRRYYDYFMTGNNNTVKDLFSLIKLDRESNNMIVTPNAATNVATNASASTTHAHSNANANNNTTNSSTNNSNNITMVLNNYAPSAIQPIDELIDIKETLNLSINLFEMWSKEKIFHRKLGDIIISNYQENDPTEQKVWCTDVNRFAYYIRTLENNEQIVEGRNKIKEIWENDKGGIKVSQYIIAPVLTCLDALLQAWLFSSDRSKDFGMHVLTKMALVANILEQITTGELNKLILQYISNYFSITKTGRSAPIKPIGDVKCIKKQQSNRSIISPPIASSLDKPSLSLSSLQSESDDEYDEYDESDESEESNTKIIKKKIVRKESTSDNNGEPESESKSEKSNKKNKCIKKITNIKIVRKESTSDSGSESESESEGSYKKITNKKIIRKELTSDSDSSVESIKKRKSIKKK